SSAPEEINPIFEAKDSTLVNKSDKLFKFFSRPEVTMEDMKTLPSVQKFISENELDTEMIEQAEIQVKYAGYIQKEKNNADKLNRLYGVINPSSFYYSIIKSLSFEAREKKVKIKPAAISQASRSSGVSPNDVCMLLVYMRR